MDVNEETENLEQQEEDEWTRGLDFILDIPLEVVVELGRSKIVINELLQMTNGSIV